MNILSGAMDLPQLHAAWFGLNKRIGLAQENLDKYEAQYRQPSEPSNFVVPTSPVSTDPEIYEVMSDLGELDSKMRYLYQSVPHLQEGIQSPRKLTNGSTWGDIIPLPENLAELHQNEANSPPMGAYQALSGNKGKGRSFENDENLPVSPRMLNVGYGTPFRSSSQFFDKPDRQKFPLPATSVLSKQNVLVGLGLPNTPAFQDIDDPPRRKNALPSRPSNPFEQRNQANINVGSSSGPYGPSRNSDVDPDSNHSSRLNRGLGGGGGGNGNPSGSGGGSGNRGNDPYGNQDGESNEDSASSRTNNRYNPIPRTNGGGDPPGDDPPGGGGGPGRGNFGNPRNGNQYQGTIPYGDTKATIRNDLKQDQLPVWDGNKNTAIEYFWKVQQLAALEGDIPQALGYWLSALAVRIDQIVLDLSISFYCIEHGYVQLPKSKVFQHLF